MFVTISIHGLKNHCPKLHLTSTKQIKEINIVSSGHSRFTEILRKKTYI